MKQPHNRIAVESLEGRSLFSVTVPAGLASEYQAVLTDNVSVRAAVGELQTTVAGQEAVIQRDVKALGKSKMNTALFAKVKTLAQKYQALAKADTAKYLATGGLLRKDELAEAAYDDHPTAANTHKFTAAQYSGLHIDAKQLHALADVYSVDSVVSLYAAIGALDAAGGGTGQLDADLQNGKTALTTQIESNNIATVRAYGDIDTLFDGEEL